MNHRRNRVGSVGAGCFCRYRDAGSPAAPVEARTARFQSRQSSAETWTSRFMPPGNCARAIRWCLTAPPIGGGALQITRLLHTGTPVRKGDIVFEFDPSEQHYKLEQSRSELLQAEQEITKAKADAAGAGSAGQSGAA